MRRDPTLYRKRGDGKMNEYSRSCPWNYRKQPVILTDKEKELIIKALRKHRNKRKNAADDLGISERTLYRKIKEYGIEI